MSDYKAYSDKAFNDALMDAYPRLVDEVAKLHKECAALQAENERLKLKKFTPEELASMKAEVELLQAQFKRDIYNQALAENERLRELLAAKGVQS